MLQKIRYFAFLLGVLVIVIVVFQNQEPVDIQVLFFSGQYPLMLLLLVCSALSFVLGAFMSAWRIRRKAKNKASKAKAAKEKSKKSKAAPTPAKPEPPADAVDELHRQPPL